MGGALGAAGSAAGATGAPSDAGIDGDAPLPCTRDCCGGKCVGGKCQPMVIYENLDGGYEPLEEIAVYDNSVYFSSTRLSGVMQIPLAGGERKTIWNKRPYVRSIAADTSGVYVAAVSSPSDPGTSGLVERVSHDGRSSVTLEAGLDSSEIVLDETHAYWRSGNSLIKRWAKAGDGSAASAVGQPVPGLGYFAIRAGRVFFQQGNRIIRRDAEGQFPDVPLMGDQAGVTSVAVNSAHVFWPLGSYKIRRAELDSVNAIDLVADALGPTTYSIADDAHIYWLSVVGRAVRAARTGTPGAAMELADGLDNLRKIAQDANCVYVTLGGNAAKIVRVAKP
jgi:hypothetical protein